MLEIRTDYGEGGAGVSTKSAQHPRLAEVLRGMIDDIGAAGGTVATIVSPDAVVAAGANPTKAEFDAVVVLVNEIKAAINAATGGGGGQTVVKSPH